MTKQAYDPEKIEKLAFRFFDLGSQMREIAKSMRQNDLTDIPLNDKKALQWLNELEIWAKKTQGSYEITVKLKFVED